MFKILSAIFISTFLFQTIGFAKQATGQAPKAMGLKFVLKKGLKKLSNGGALESGQESDLQFGWMHPGTAEPAYYTMGSGALSSSTDFTVTSDGCSGTTLHSGDICWVRAKFSPVGAEDRQDEYNIPWTAMQTDGITTYNGNVNEQLRGWGIVKTGVDDANPKAGCGQEELPGSIVRVDSQSLGEYLPVVGTDFVLSYSSEFAQSYIVASGLTSGHSFFNPNGWTLSIQHYFDVSQSILYRGTGTSYPNSPYGPTTSNFQVASIDGSEVYLFAPSGKHLETKFGLTGATKYSFGYDGSNRLASITDASGNITTFSYVTGGFTITAPFGQVTTVTLNSNQLISSIANPNSEAHSFTYKTGTDLLETFTKPGGQVNTFTYSSTGRLTQNLRPGGAFWNLVEVLNPTERQVTLSSALGRSTVYRSLMEDGEGVRYSTESFGEQTEYRERHDHQGTGIVNSKENVQIYSAHDNRFGLQVRRLFMTTVLRGSTTKTTSFDRVYNPVNPTSFFTFNSVTDTETTGDRARSRVYTTANKTSVVTSELGATATQIIDSFERVVSSKIGSDTPWTYTYDTLGHLTGVAQGLYNTLTKTYNTAGLLNTVTNARSEVTSYVYDLAGRVTQITRPDSKVIAYAYDANGNVTGITPPGRLQHAFEFNALEMLSKYDPPTLSGLSVKETLYSYNLDKQLTSVVRPDMQSALYTYGASTGLLNKIALARGDMNFTYQTNTDLVSRIDSADGIRSNFTYFGNDVSSIEQRRASDDFLYAKIQFGYDMDFRRTSRSIRGGSSPAYSTIITTLNKDDLPSQIGDLKLSYTYPSGRLENTSINKISDTRTYDALGNLQSYTANYNPTSGPSQVLYSYTLTRDVMSRIVGKSETIQGVTSTYVYSYDNVGRLTGVTKNGTTYSSYAYDDNGNRVSGSVNGVAFTATYDAHDRLATYNARTYAYNANGDNTQIQWTSTTQSTFSYDALGNLLTATTPTGASLSYLMDSEGNIARLANGGVTLSRYIYDDRNRIAGEFTDAGVMWRQFVYGTDSNSPDYAIDSTGNLRYIKDHLGSPRLIVKVTDGTVMQRMDYDEFGRVIANTNPTYQPFGFAGGLYLRLPGLVKFGARYYDAEVGRWTTKDPILFDGEDENLYGYTWLDPVNYIDSDGLKSEAYTFSADGAAGWGGPMTPFAIPSLLDLFSDPVCNKKADLNPDEGNKPEDYGKKPSEHTSNQNKSKEEKHERGQARQRRDRGGEKKDARMPYRRK